MASRIHRKSMENLVLFDLDNLASLPFYSQQPLPLPLPPKHESHSPSRKSFERYGFLCNAHRQKTDPVYAATPMFTTIPQVTPPKHSHQLLGSRIPPDIIKPLPTKPSVSVKSDNDENKGTSPEEPHHQEVTHRADGDDDNENNYQNQVNASVDADNYDVGKNSASVTRNDMGVDDIINNDDDNIDDDDDDNNNNNNNDNTKIAEQTPNDDKTK